MKILNFPSQKTKAVKLRSGAHHTANIHGINDTVHVANVVKNHEEAARVLNMVEQAVGK